MVQRDRGRGRAVPARLRTRLPSVPLRGLRAGTQSSLGAWPTGDSERLSILDLARIHHTVLLEVLKTHRTPNELEHIAEAASEFFVEALAVFEMTHRGFTELASTDQPGRASTQGDPPDVMPDR